MTIYCYCIAACAYIQKIVNKALDKAEGKTQTRYAQ